MEDSDAKKHRDGSRSQSHVDRDLDEMEEEHEAMTRVPSENFAELQKQSKYRQGITKNQSISVNRLGLAIGFSISMLMLAILLAFISGKLSKGYSERGVVQAHDIVTLGTLHSEIFWQARKIMCGLAQNDSAGIQAKLDTLNDLSTEYGELLQEMFINSNVVARSGWFLPLVPEHIPIMVNQTKRTIVSDDTTFIDLLSRYYLAAASVSSTQDALDMQNDPGLLYILDNGPYGTLPGVGELTNLFVTTTGGTFLAFDRVNFSFLGVIAFVIALTVLGFFVPSVVNIKKERRSILQIFKDIPKPTGK